MNSKRSSISEEFLGLASNLNLIIIKEVLYNRRKKTATFLVKHEKTHRKFVLKCFSNKSPQIEKKRFKSEIDFYTKVEGFEITPTFIESGSNYLLLEYIEGKTLRERIIEFLRKDLSNNNISEFHSFLRKQSHVIIKQYEKILTFQDESPIHIDTFIATEKLVELYLKLSVSGPFSTKRSCISFMTSKILAFLSRIKVKEKIRAVLKANPFLLRAGFTHEDLHLDNILVSNKYDQLFVIDFANYQKKGLIIYDLVYFLTTVLTLLEARPKTQAFFLRISSDLLKDFHPSAIYILKLALILHHVSKTNSRFNSEVPFSKIIVSYFFFYRNLKQE